MFRRKEQEESEETIPGDEFRTTCIKCGAEVVGTVDVRIPKNPKIKKPKRGKPYYDIDYPEDVLCPKGCTGTDPDTGKPLTTPIVYQLYVRRYVEGV